MEGKVGLLCCGGGNLGQAKHQGEKNTMRISKSTEDFMVQVVSDLKKKQKTLIGRPLTGKPE